MSRLGDSKGAELLNQLKAGLTSSEGQTRSPAPPSQKETSIGQGMGPPRAPSPYLTPDAQKAARTLKKKKAQNSGNKGITLIKCRNAEERALYRQAVCGQETDPKVQRQPSRSTETCDFGEAAFRKLTPLRESFEGFSANLRSPSDIVAADADRVRRGVELGAGMAATVVDFHDGYFLGYDFGTSTTKVVARYPHGPLDRAFAIPVPLSVASGGQPHLFPTAVYWNPTRDLFSLVPDEGYVRLDSFKSALIHGRGHRVCGSGIIMAHAAAAFIALHLAYCIASAIEVEPEFRLASVNVGVPVAVLDGDSTALFDRVMRAATRLVRQAPTLSRADIEAAFQADEVEALPFTRHAELSGAIAGYCAATRHYLGGHMIIDCGSATLDIVTFDLSQQTHRPIGIYAASVENLGADACALYVKGGRTPEECRDAVRFEEHAVYRETIKSKPSLFCYENGRYPYQIILIGGGIHGEIHATFLTTLAKAFKTPFHQPIVAPTLSYDSGCEAGRLILADGLARDPIELKEVVLPKPPPPPEWKDPLGPSKDQV